MSQGLYVALIGPHGAGKSSLAKALAAMTNREFNYEIEQLVTTRQRRPGEDDQEYSFVDQVTFNRELPNYYMVQPNRGVAWTYALPALRPIADHTVRLYVVLPETAQFLKSQYPETTLLCAVLPPSEQILEQRLTGRDTTISKAEFDLRWQRATTDITLAEAMADVVFYNEDGLEWSANKLAAMIENHITRGEQ